eukprot:Clim_evm41s88 gene=Clim_evmTU41s88
MAQQSGIAVGSELESRLSQAREAESGIRAVKVVIVDESLCIAENGTKSVSGSMEDDYDSVVNDFISDQKPCYMLIRTDEKNPSGGNYNWTLILYVPDNAMVRMKMLYASTKLTLRKGFGADYVKYDIYGTVPEDVNLAGFQASVRHDESAAPLTQDEEIAAEIKKFEGAATHGISTRGTNQMGGIALGLNSDAIAGVTKMVNGDADCVVLSINIKDEQIHCVRTENGTTPEQISALAPEDHPCYILFKTELNGEPEKKNVFIYASPGFKGSIKERMMYASAKETLIDELKQQGLEFARRMEITEHSELAELAKDLNPPKVQKARGFAKPKKAGRGARTVIT